jgi:acyl-CoA reductase-like NAD-dependent aldehyde dehydrogenase
MQACGRLTDIEFLGHRHEVAQVTSFHGLDIPKVSQCHQIDIIQAHFGDSSFRTEMKNKRDTLGDLVTTDTGLTPTEVWSAKIYSNGWKKPGLGTADVTEKATGAKLGEIGIASPEDVSAAAAVARQAQKSWAKVPGPKRGDVLREFSRLLLARSDEIADQIIRETGSIRAKAQWEIQMAAREFLEAAALGSHPQGILTADLEAGRQSIARRIPVGVVGIITPWNSPFILGARMIGPALAMGNAVILKPDVQTPVAGGVTFARLLEAAGLPDGLFHVLPGGPETGAALVKEPLVDMISFTGSTRAGRQVGSIAAHSSSASLSSLAATIPTSCWTMRTSRPRPARAPGEPSSTRDRSASPPVATSSMSALLTPMPKPS